MSEAVEHMKGFLEEWGVAPFGHRDVEPLIAVLAERDVLASIVKDLAGSEVLRPQPPQSLLASFCDVCGNAVALDGDHGEADWCAWWRACVWLDQQGEKK